MNLEEIPTPETDEIYLMRPEGIRARKCRDLERRLHLARTALESITHDMGASQMIHALCAQTLKLIEPKP